MQPVAASPASGQGQGHPRLLLNPTTLQVRDLRAPDAPRTAEARSFLNVSAPAGGANNTEAPATSQPIRPSLVSALSSGLSQYEASRRARPNVPASAAIVNPERALLSGLDIPMANWTEGSQSLASNTSISAQYFGHLDTWNSHGHRSAFQGFRGAELGWNSLPSEMEAALVPMGAAMLQASGLTEPQQQAPSSRELERADLFRQRDPLGTEIQAWVNLTGNRIHSVHAFDHEENAQSFARLLSRLREGGAQGTSMSEEDTAAKVSLVIQAIANDPDLRSQVFGLAETALGSCSDKLDEGFSDICLSVENRRMEKAVGSGEVNAKQLDDWARSLFRLSLLEGAVRRFIHAQLQSSDVPTPVKKQLRDEPLEIMVHAQVALREQLGLPESTPSAMRWVRCSVLTEEQLSMLEQEVKDQAKNSQAHGKFLLSHETWRAGMKALHAQEFKDLKTQQDDDPFHDIDPPEDEDVEGQAEYAAQALQAKAKFDDEENALLLRLAAKGA
jgi:hypothetical protein